MEFGLTMVLKKPSLTLNNLHGIVVSYFDLLATFGMKVDGNVGVELRFVIRNVTEYISYILLICINENIFYLI